MITTMNTPGPDPEFERAVKEVFDENAGLMKRLAQRTDPHDLTPQVWRLLKHKEPWEPLVRRHGRHLAKSLFLICVCFGAGWILGRLLAWLL